MRDDTHATLDDDVSVRDHAFMGMYLLLFLAKTLLFQGPLGFFSTKFSFFMSMRHSILLILLIRGYIFNLSIFNLIFNIKISSD